MASTLQLRGSLEKTPKTRALVRQRVIQSLTSSSSSSSSPSISKSSSSWNTQRDSVVLEHPSSSSSISESPLPSPIRSPPPYTDQCAKLSLVLVGPQLPKKIRALASYQEYTFAAYGSDIGVFKCAHQEELQRTNLRNAGFDKWEMLILKERSFL
ncbi:hypothetical protein NL676_021463 [Syzygium grande]|nr:hypothetical protein NL676_021463 [Syzygium grande]